MIDAEVLDRRIKSDDDVGGMGGVEEVEFDG